MSAEVYNRALQLTAEICGRRYRSIVESADVEKVTTFLLALKTDIRLYLLQDATMGSDFWDQMIREEEAVIDFLLPTTIELRLRLVDNNAQWLDFANSVGEAYGFVTPDSGSMIDEDTFNRLPTGHDFKTLVQANPWLVMCCLIESVDLGVLTGAVPNGTTTSPS